MDNMENKKFIESREFLRIEISFSVDSEINEEFKKKFQLLSEKILKADTKDISVGGLGIICNYFLPNGLVLDLELDGKPFGLKTKIKIRGEIRYCVNRKDAGYMCGIKFLNISESDRKAIANYVAAHDKRKFPRLQLSD